MTTIFGRQLGGGTGTQGFSDNQQILLFTNFVEGQPLDFRRLS